MFHDSCGDSCVNNCGGAGGRTIRGTNGESGTPTYVSISAGSAATDRIIVATSGTFGGGGSGSVAGTAGGGAGASIDTAIGKLGVTSYYAGQGGGANIPSFNDLYKATE